MGSKFKIPRFKLKKAMNMNSWRGPRRAVSPEASAIPMGPDNVLIDARPERSLPRNDERQAREALRLPERRGKRERRIRDLIDYRRCRIELDPDEPAVAVFLGGEVELEDLVDAQNSDEHRRPIPRFDGVDELGEIEDRSAVDFGDDVVWSHARALSGKVFAQPQNLRLDGGEHTRVSDLLVAACFDVDVAIDRHSVSKQADGQRFVRAHQEVVESVAPSFGRCAFDGDDLIARLEAGTACGRVFGDEAHHTRDRRARPAVRCRP